MMDIFATVFFFGYIVAMIVLCGLIFRETHQIKRMCDERDRRLKDMGI